MKRFVAIFVALALSPAISYAASAETPVQLSGGRIYLVSGSVTVAQGRNPAHLLSGSEVVVSDTMINTGDNSAALLKFEDGQIVTIQANSAFHVFEYRYDARRIEKSNIVFSMFKGGMRFVTGLIGQRKKQAFRLLTPNATIGIRGTEFMVAIVDNTMYSQVMSGSISLTNAAGSMTLGAGQSAVVASSSTLATSVSAAAIPAGTFSGLISIPLNPAAISAPAPVPAPVPVPPPVPVPVPEPVPAVVPIPEPFPAPEPAPEPTVSDSSYGNGLSAKIGTLGYGAELNVGFSDSFSTRFGVNGYSYKRNANSGTVNYDFKLQLQTASALADWYPFSGSFRTSGGVFYNNNKLSFGANSTGGNIIVNGVTYSSAQVATLEGTMTFNRAAPYIGIGWGNPVAKDKGWGMISDFGVLYQGSPKTNLAATCSAAIAGTATCTQLESDAAAENIKLQDALRKAKWWPVVSFGISYQW